MSAPRRTRDSIGGSRYRFVCNLGRGGMADVQLVVQTSPAGVERLAVLKRARAELANQPEFADMFLEEARIAATLSHQNVVQTYEVGHDDRGYFLVLEFLRGQSYGKIQQTSGYADYRVALEVLLGTLLGLEYAHALKHLSGREMGLVHRDISPPNIFVTYDGQVKVLDFGIAKALDSKIETDTGVIKGKVAYMSPEQMHGEPLDQRADLYAVGVMLWEATAGRRRFEGVPDVAVVSAVISQRAPLSPGAVERGLPALADAICARALAYDPEQRYASAAEFHQDLSALADLVGGRLAPRALGQFVSDRFAAEQAELQGRIEVQLDLPGSANPSSWPTGRTPTGSDSRPNTRTLPPREANEAVVFGVPGSRELLTAPGLQTESSKGPAGASPWKVRVGLAAAALVAVLYFAFSSMWPRRAAPLPAPAAATTGGQAIMAGSTGEAAPAIVASATLTEPLPAPAAPSASVGERKTKVSRAKPLVAAPKPKPVSQRVSPTPTASTKIGLDRSNPWAP